MKRARTFDMSKKKHPQHAGKLLLQAKLCSSSQTSFHEFILRRLGSSHGKGVLRVFTGAINWCFCVADAAARHPADMCAIR